MYQRADQVIFGTLLFEVRNKGRAACKADTKRKTTRYDSLYSDCKDNKSRFFFSKNIFDATFSFCIALVTLHISLSLQIAYCCSCSSVLSSMQSFSTSISKNRTSCTLSTWRRTACVFTSGEAWVITCFNMPPLTG